MVVAEQGTRTGDEMQDGEFSWSNEAVQKTMILEQHLLELLTSYPILTNVFTPELVHADNDRRYFFTDDIRDVLHLSQSTLNHAWTEWCVKGGVSPIAVRTSMGVKNTVDVDRFVDFLWFTHAQASGYAKLKISATGDPEELLTQERILRSLSVMVDPVEQPVRTIFDQATTVIEEALGESVVEGESPEGEPRETDMISSVVVYPENNSLPEPKPQRRRRRTKSEKEMPDDPMGGYEVDSDDEETSNYEDEFNPDESEEPLDDEEAYREEDGAEFQLVNSEQMDEDLLAQINPDDPVGMYFRQMAQEPLLEAAKEVELAKRIELGKVASERLNTFPSGEDTSQPELQQLIDDGQAAREHLARANTRLVVSVAKRYIGQGLPFSDVIQEGNLGLMRAVDKYDYMRGNRFSTYATWWIRQAITRALAQKTRTIRIPLHMTERIRQMYRTSQVMEQNLGRRPYPEELAAELGEPVDTIHGMLEVSQHAISLQRPVGDDENAEYGDFIEDQDSPSPVELATHHALRETIEEVLSELQPRNRYIIKLRFGLIDGEQHTLEDIAAEFGLSRERIRQLEKEALRRLRHPHLARALRDYLG